MPSSPEPDQPPPSIPHGANGGKEDAARSMGGGGEEEKEASGPRPSSAPVDVPPTSTEMPAAGGRGDARRTSQRLWTDEEEITILQGFYEFTTRRRTGTTHHHDRTPSFHDQIRSRIRSGFTKSQLIEKLRRLKKKYRNVASRGSFAFRSPHDRATFDLSQKIWGAGGRDGEHVEYGGELRKRPRGRATEGADGEAAETLRRRATTPETSGGGLASQAGLDER